MPFVQVTFNLKPVASYELREEVTNIGRTPNNHIVIDNPGVSASHARIVKKGEEYYFDDLGSRNGSFLGKDRIDRHQLSYGDVITIFKHQLRFVPIVAEDAPRAGKEVERGAINQGATMVIDRVQLPGIGGKEQRTELLVSGKLGSRSFILEKHGYCIGKSEICLVKTRGWFAPSISARLIRQASDYQLIPARKKEVKVNDTWIEDSCRLQNGDTIDIRKLRILYKVVKVESD